MDNPGHVWHSDAVTPAVKQVLSVLGKQKITRSFYLAGGTALALHVGHRRSVDLDLFTANMFDEEQLLSRLQLQTGLSVVSRDYQTLHLHIDGVKVSFLGYAYTVLFPFMRLSGIDVADPRDIACMKISAIAGRGTRRDFIDLYVAARKYGLKRLLELFQKKYERANYNPVHILKSLTYFADAEREPNPDLLIPLTWDEVAQFFREEVPRLS